MHPLHCLTALAITLPAFAQETYWVANRASNDIMQVSAWGSVMRRIAMPSSLRSAHVAPDGKIWVVRFIQTTFDIVDPVTASITPVTFGLGSPYDIAFDAQGTAWVSGGSGVQQFDANGVSLQTFPLSNAAPLGITIDSNGNKWIAHRTSPGSVTRIDTSTPPVVTNYSLSPSTTQAVRPVADFRGLGNPSHIWVTGDPTGSIGQLVELDVTGAVLNVYTMPTSAIGGSGPVFDKNGDIWVGNYGTGAVYQVDETSGLVLNTYTFPPSAIGLSVDSLGRILAVARVTFSGVGPPCEVRRIDPATGVLEIPTLLTIGGLNASGTQSAVSTPFQYALVVAPLGDMDGDGDANYAEVVNGTSPIDPTSNAAFSLDSTGTTSIGSTMYFNVQAAGSTVWVLGFADGLLNPGIPVPGFAGLLVVDPALLIGTLSGFGSSNLPLPIPSVGSLQGYEMFVQGLMYAGGPMLEFRNVSGLKVW